MPKSKTVQSFLLKDIDLRRGQDKAIFQTGTLLTIRISELQKCKISTDQFLTQKISTKKWPKNDLKLPKIAQK